VHPSVNGSEMFVLSRTAEYIVSLFDIQKQAIIYQFWFFPVMPPTPHFQDHVLLMI